MSKETMQLALDEFKHIRQWCLRSIGIGLVNENVLAALEEALAKQEQREPEMVRNMRMWVTALKSVSDNGQHMKIPSGLSSGTCWELAVALEQFINTTPQPAPQGEPVAIPEYVRDAAIHLHENGCREPLFMVKAIVGWINNAQKALAKQEQNQPATKDQIREAIVFNLPLYTTLQPAHKPLTDEFGILAMTDIGNNSVQLIFESRKYADEFKAAHSIKE